MIRSFKSRPLQRFWERNDASKLPPDRIKRITMEEHAVQVDFEDYH